MGTTITTVRVDDFDGSEAGTWSLRMDGTDYELDLTPANSARLPELLAPYIAAARKLSRTTRRSEQKHNYIPKYPTRQPPRKTNFDEIQRLNDAKERPEQMGPKQPSSEPNSLTESVRGRFQPYLGPAPGRVQ